MNLQPQLPAPAAVRAMLATGAAYFLVTMLPAVDSRWRDFDRRPDREPAVAVE